MNAETSHGLSNIDNELAQIKWDNYYIHNLYSGSFRPLNYNCEEVMIKLAINHSYTFSWGSLWAEFRYPPLMHSLLKFHLIKIDYEINQMGEDRVKCSLTPLGVRYVHDNMPFLQSKWLSPISTSTIYVLASISFAIITYTLFLILSIVCHWSTPSFLSNPFMFSISDLIASTLISGIVEVSTYSICCDDTARYSDEYVARIARSHPAPTEADFLKFLFDIKGWSRYPKQDYGYAQLAIDQILYI